MRGCFVVLIGAALLGCLDDPRFGSSEEAIIGGTPAAEGEIPAMAMIGTDPAAFGRFTLWCGGTVIGEHHIATAAHCLDVGEPIVDPTDLVVVTDKVSVSDFVLGDLNLVLGAAIHPHYDPFTFRNDIAILEVAEAMMVPTMPVLAPRSDERLLVAGQPMVVAGWGATEPDDFGASRDLLRTDVPIVDRALCDELYAQSPYSPNHVTSEMVCAGLLDTGGADACLGDSGGPLLAERNGSQLLGGVVNFGVGCGDSEFPGVYARASTAAPWLSRCVGDPDLCGDAPSELASIRPRLDCVEPLGDGRFRAHFGYDNDNAISIGIIGGPDNLTFPRGEPTETFEPGRNEDAALLEFRHVAAWLLFDPAGGPRLAIAHRYSPQCAATQ